MIRSTKLCLFLCIVLLGCSRASSDHDEHAKEPTKPAASGSAHVDEPEHEALPRRVRLEPAVIEDAKIVTAPVAKEPLSPTVSLPGEIGADPDRSARVASPVPGRIESVAFKEGAVVKKGDLLAVIRIPELGKVRAALAAASAKGKAARANAERLHALVEKGLAATQEAVAAKADADALEAEARALAEQLGALGVGAGATGSSLSLRAPVGGVVIARDAVVGQPVTAEQVLASIADLSEVWFLGRVFEKDLGKLTLGAKAEVRLNAYPDERFEGAVDMIGRQIDPGARTVLARIRLVNRKDLLRLGLFGEAGVAVAGAQGKAPTLVVPRSALVEVAGKTVVFVRQADGDFELHDVVLGEGALGKVQVISGLREAENVVVEGAFTLKSAVLKSTLAEDE